MIDCCVCIIDKNRGLERHIKTYSDIYPSKFSSDWINNPNNGNNKLDNEYNVVRSSEVAFGRMKSLSDNVEYVTDTSHYLAVREMVAAGYAAAATTTTVAASASAIISTITELSLSFDRLIKSSIDKSGNEGGEHIVRVRPIPQVLVVASIGVLIFAVIAAILSTLTLSVFSTPIERYYGTLGIVGCLLCVLFLSYEGVFKELKKH